MHILFDARALQAHLDGIGRYCIGVIRAMGSIRPDWKRTVIAGPDALDHLQGMEIKLIPSSVPRFRFGENAKLSPVIEGSGADIYMNFSMAGPRPDLPTFTAVHDVMVLTVPGYFGSSMLRNLLARYHFRKRIRSSVRHSDVIPVLSRASLEDLQKLFPEAGSKAFIAGAGQDLFKEVVGSEERSEFILYVGNARAYKNVTRLIVAYSRLKAINPKFPSMKMVVRRDRSYKEFMREIDDCSAGDSIDVISHVSDPELRKLYRNCRYLIMPSLKEGFGLPALEAMSCGTPVIVSAGTSLEEIVGDAGVLVDPSSVIDIMRGMALLASDGGLAGQLSRRALKRALLFTWENTAEKIACRMEEVIS